MAKLNRAAILSDSSLKADYNRFAEIHGLKNYAYCNAESIAKYESWVAAGRPEQPSAEPVATAVSTTKGSVEQHLTKVLDMLGYKAQVDLEKVRGMIATEVAKAFDQLQGKTLNIQIGNLPAVKMENSFPALPDVLIALSCKENVWLYGPSGSGKTTMAQKAISQAFGLQPNEVSVVSCFYQLSPTAIFGGPLNATTWSDGALKGKKLVIFDEVTKLHPAVAGALNHLLEAREYMDPQTGEVISVADTMFVATSNILFGESAVYNGNQKQDASLMQRFGFKADVDYNEAFERDFAKQHGVEQVAIVLQSMRQSARAAKMSEVISTRDLINIVKLVKSGMRAVKAFEHVLGMGSDASRSYGMGWSVDKIEKVSWKIHAANLNGAGL